MFERFFGLRENPFPAGHQLRFLYPSREHQEARAHLRYGIENREPFVLITGEVGTGKTTALYDALGEWGNQVQVSLITNSALSRQELLEEIGLRFGLDLPPGLSKPQTLVQLERFLHTIRTRGDYAVLVLDEAHNLATDLLEEIRLLSNLEAQGENLLQIFMVGQPELEQKLSRPELRQLRQRISVHYRLNPLSPEETAGYIHHRISVVGGNAWVIFPPDACREVYRITHGIPREINTVATAAMLTAYTENSPTVRPHHVLAFKSETEFRSVLSEEPLASDEALGLSDAGGEAAAPPPAAAPEPPRPVRAMPAPEPPPAPRSAPAAAIVPPDVQPGTWQPRPLDDPRTAAHEIAPADAPAVDPWSLAARELLEAKRRSTGAPSPAAPPAPIEPAPRRAAPPLPPEPAWAARGHSAEPAPLPFPSPAELARRRGADPHAAPALDDLPPAVRDELEAQYGKPASRSRRAPAVPEEEWPPRRRPPWAWIGGAIALVVAIAAVVWKLKAGGLLGGVPPGAVEPQPAEVRPPAVEAGAAQVQPPGQEPAAATGPEPSPPLRPSATSTSPSPPASEPAPRPEAAPPAGATTPASPASATRYGIAVGEYLNEERAYVERDRLGNATGLATRVLPYREQGVTMYRLVLGAFGTRDEAENAASELFGRGLVPQASVMPLTR